MNLRLDLPKIKRVQGKDEFVSMYFLVLGNKNNIRENFISAEIA